MRITEFARKLGVSRDTLRRWERRGIITPDRDWAGHRRFDEEDLARLQPMVRGQARVGPDD
jgi:excisionase family DNA binding protein